MLKKLKEDNTGNSTVKNTKAGRGDLKYTYKASPAALPCMDLCVCVCVILFTVFKYFPF